MKKLALTNPSFKYLETSFAEWLDIQGYSKSTVYNLPIHIREFLHYLEEEGVQDINGMDTKHIKKHYENLKQRSNAVRGGGLSGSHLNKHGQALKRFVDYLRKVGRKNLPAVKLESEVVVQSMVYLSGSEIGMLFAATHHQVEEKPRQNTGQQTAMQSRDRAMLAIFYGCGLRRNEGVNDDISDINFDRSILHVRKGKNNKERMVPISKTSLKHLQEYIYDHRHQLVRSKVEALFLSQQGKRMQGQSLLLRLKRLQYLTEDLDLNNKEIGLHTLRHSIATHLLGAGMKLESISKFLGHNSLESTQIYTHLIAEASSEGDQPYNNIPTYENHQPHEDEDF